uniref:Uncharacterized protein n=1 Tax=Globodera rostochiensis TaxID=31243 RepID=A0A914IFT2_GLORO
MSTAYSLCLMCYKVKFSNVSDDVWLGVFAFVGRAELGLKLAIVSDRFDVLVDLYLKTRKWTIGTLEIQQAQDGNSAEILKLSKSFTYESVPIPQQPVPTNVIGFERICIRFIDQNVIAFLHRSQRLFDAHFVLTLEYYSNNEAFWDTAIAEIWPLLMAKLGALSLGNAGLAYLRSFISPTILRDCTGLREATADQALSKWLHTPREHGQSKLLKCCTWAAYPMMVEKLKMAFLCALTPVSYLHHHFMLCTSA